MDHPYGPEWRGPSMHFLLGFILKGPSAGGLELSLKVNQKLTKVGLKSWLKVDHKS